MLRLENFSRQFVGIFGLEYHQYILWYFLSFSCGIILFFSISLPSSFYVFSLLVVLLLLITNMKFSDAVIWHFLLFYSIFFLFGISVGFVRIYFSSHPQIQRAGIYYVSGVAEQIMPLQRKYQLIISDVELKKPKNLENVENLDKIRINLSEDYVKNINNGDVVSLKAKLFPLQNSILPGTFDFGFFLNTSGIGATGFALTKPVIEAKGEGAYEYIQDIRTKIYQKIITSCNWDEANFIAAILIGQTKGLSEHVSQAARNSGIAHILCVSGLHLSLVSIICFGFGRLLVNLFCASRNIDSKSIAAIFAVGGSFVYLILSGNNIAAQRAFIMTTIFTLSILIGRKPYYLRSVTYAGFCILAIIPEYIFHPSFQLSFVAVLAMLSGYEFLKKLENRQRGRGFFFEIKKYFLANIYTSILATAVTTPFVIYHFYKFAGYGVIMNLIAVPLMSFVMMPLSILALPLMIIDQHYFIMQIISACASFIIYWSVKTCDLPFAVINTGYITSSSLLLFTIGFATMCFFRTKLRLVGIFIICFSVLLMCMNSPSASFIYSGKFKAKAFFDANNELNIISQKPLPKFIRNYWCNWQGVNDSLDIIDPETGRTDEIINLDHGKSLALSYNKCQQADLQIITSNYLQCPNAIYANKYQQPILIFCNLSGCFAKTD